METLLAFVFIIAEQLRNSSWLVPIEAVQFNVRVRPSFGFSWSQYYFVS